MTMIRGIALVISMVWLSGLNAQYSISETQYITNESLINPAYVASKENVTIKANLYKGSNYSEQTITTQSVSAYGSLKYYDIGFGVAIKNYNNGNYHKRIVNSAFAYKIKRGENELSFGINMGVKTQKEIIRYHSGFESETKINTSKNMPQRYINPYIGSGIYFQNPDFSFGVAIPYFFKKNTVNTDTLAGQDEAMLYFINGSYLIRGNKNNVKIYTDIQGKGSSGIEAGMGVLLYMGNKFTMGANYKTSKKVGVISQYSWTKNTSLTYSCEFYTAQSTTNLFSSHEITLKHYITMGYKYNRNKLKYF